MKRTLICGFIIISCLLSSACANIQSQKRSNTLNSQLNDFRKAIRWGHLPAAASMQKPREGNVSPLSDDLKNLRVVSYEHNPPALGEDGLEALLTAEIRYYFDDSANIRTLRYPQTWYYDETSERWWLDGELPEFK